MLAVHCYNTGIGLILVKILIIGLQYQILIPAQDYDKLFIFLLIKWRRERQFTKALIYKIYFTERALGLN